MRLELEDALRTTIEIANRQRNLREKIRQALKSGDITSVVRYAGQLVGFADEESDRPRTRQQQGSGSS